MATISATWNAAGGNWFSAANWNEPDPGPPATTVHYVPGANNDVTIPDNSGVATPFSIAYAGTSTVNTLTSAGNLTLNVTSGSLTTANGGFGFGTLNVSAGATFAVGAGTFSLNNLALSGTLAGAGTFRQINGTFDINAGASITVDTWLLTYQIGSGTVSTTNLNTDLTYAHNFQLLDVFGNFPILNLNSHTLTLSGTTTTLDGVINGPGTVNISGAATVSGGSVAAGAKLQVSGAVTQTGGFGLGGTVQVDAGATYTIGTASSINDIGSALVVNNGTFGVTGAGLSVLSGAFTNNAALTVAAGAELVVNAGAETLNGTIAGAGKLTFGFAHAAVWNMTSLTVGTVLVSGGNGGGTVSLARDVSYGGSFTLADTGTFDLNTHKLVLGGTSLFTAGNIDGTGTLQITGTATIGGIGIGTRGDNGAVGPVTFRNSGTVSQNSFLSVNGTILNDAGHSYTIIAAADSSSTGSAGLTVTNNGTFADTAAGISRINGNFTNSATGTIAVGAGAELSLQTGTHLLNGAISGAGQLTFGFAHNATLNTASLSVASIYINGGNGGGTLSLGKDIAYGGSFTFANAFGTLDLNGHLLTLSGPSTLVFGNIDGAGTVRVTGSSTIGGLGIGTRADNIGVQPATFRNSGTVTQNGDIFVNGSALNDAGHTWSLAGFNVTTTGAGGSFTNSGILNAGLSGATSVISTGFVNAAGATVNVSSGAALRLSGVSSLSGTIGGAGELRLAGTATVNTAITTASLAFLGNTTLAANLTYSGQFSIGTFSYHQPCRSFAGPRRHGRLTSGFNTINGSGLLRVTGSADLGGVGLGDGGALTFQNSGAVHQVGSTSIVGAIINDAGRTWTLDIGDITNNAATFTNNGTLLKSGDAGGSTISPAFTNNGLVAVDDGTLVIQNLSNVGILRGVVTQDGSKFTLTADAAGHVTLTGGTGDNLLDGRGGVSTMAGGAGNDTYIVDNANDVVIEGRGRRHERSGHRDDELCARCGRPDRASDHKQFRGHERHRPDRQRLCPDDRRQQRHQHHRRRRRRRHDAGLWRQRHLYRRQCRRRHHRGRRRRHRRPRHHQRQLCARCRRPGGAPDHQQSAGTAAIDLTGNGFAQTIVGNNGINTIDGSGGADTMQGVGGNDTYIVDNAGDVIIEGAGEGTDDRVVTSVSYALNAAAQVETLTTNNSAGTGAIDLTGNELCPDHRRQQRHQHHRWRRRRRHHAGRGRQRHLHRRQCRRLHHRGGGRRHRRPGRHHVSYALNAAAAGGADHTNNARAPAPST